MAWIEHPALDRAMAAERADRNYEKFQVRANEPGARLAEQQQFWKHEGSNPGGWNYSQIARPSGMNQWNVSTAQSSIGLDDPENIERGWHTKTRDKYYDQMKGRNQFHREDMNRRLFLYPEMEEEYNFGYNSGGIASLENRPGYRWGGSPSDKWSKFSTTNIPGTDKNISRHLEQKKWGNFFEKPRYEKFERSWVPQDAGPFKSGAYEFYQSPLGTRTGMRVEPEWYHQRGHKGFNEGEEYNEGESYSPTIDQVSHLYEDEYEAGFPPDPNKPYVPSVLNPWRYQEGGAVGLEPGIGSLMGYAKGGMVTKMKVKKGQSKWLKKFMNNMRDN